LEGNLYRSSELNDQAITYYDQAIAQDPTFLFYAYYYRVFCLIKKIENPFFASGQKEKMTVSKEDLAKICQILQDYQKPNLILMHLLLSDQGKNEKISKQIQAEFCLVQALEESAQEAIQAIQIALSNREKNDQAKRFPGLDSADSSDLFLQAAMSLG
jgi:tetratricopeptide (TPR) repeat protein